MFANLSPQAASRSLSATRLNFYRTFFDATSDREALGAMVWHHAVSSSLWPLLGVLEVVFRNRCHFALSMLYGGVASRNWFAPGPNNMRLHGGLREKINELLADLNPANNTPSKISDEFISRTTFGIWLEVLKQLEKDRRYKLCRNLAPGLPSLKEKSDWSSPSKAWTPFFQKIEKHKAVRDAVAHHGPLWTISYKTQPENPPARPSGAGALILALRYEATAIRTTICEMEPHICDFWDGDQDAHFKNLTTLATLQKYMGKDVKKDSTTAVANDAGAAA